MIVGLFLFLTGLVVMSALIHSHFLAKEVTRLQTAATEQIPAETGTDDEMADRDFALSWYHAGVEKGWDMKSKDKLITDLTVNEAFSEEWAALEEEEAEA